MSEPSASFSVTMRVVLSDAHQIGAVAAAITERGGTVVALDVVDAHLERPEHLGKIVFDVTYNAAGEAHAAQFCQAVEEVEGAVVQAVSDRTMLVHLGGLVTVVPKVALKTRDDLSMAYTPGSPGSAWRSPPTLLRHGTSPSSATASPWSPTARPCSAWEISAQPVMEGKAALFQRFGGVDAWPVCIDSHDVDEIVRTVELIVPSYGGINLEDIAAPRCFAIERRLRESLDIPVFHDDQHGRAGPSSSWPGC